MQVSLKGQLINDDTTLQLLKFHRSMLEDTERVETFRAAIHEVVRPGDVVVDIGSGTGLLSYFACQAGAKHVYAIEMGKIIHLARQISRANGLDDRITFLSGVSTDIDLPEKADVLVSETLGSLGPEEGILSWMADAWERHLKPTAQIIPRDLAIYLVPLHLPHKWQELAFWSSTPFDLDYTATHSLAANCLSRAHFSPADWLSQPRQLAYFDLSQAQLGYSRFTLTFPIAKTQLLHGFGGWFDSQLSEQVTLKTGHTTNTPSWTSAYFPLSQPLTVEADSEVEITVGMDAGGSHCQWRVKAGDVTLNHATLNGQIFDPAGLRKRSNTHQATLNLEAQILQRTLSLMDGSRTITAIAQQLAHDFPYYYTNADEAITRVRNLAMAYSQ